MIACSFLLLLTFLSFLSVLENAIPSSSPVSIRTLRAAVCSIAGIMLLILVTGTIGVCHRWVVIIGQISMCTILFIHTGPARSAAIIRCYFRDLRRGFIEYMRSSYRSPALLLGMAVVLWQMAWCGLITGFVPPHVWDELAYHIPIVAGIVQTGTLTPLDLSYPCNAYFSGSTHLVYAWTAMIGCDSNLLSLTHWMFWMLASLAGYTMLRHFRVDHSLAGFLTACALGCPIFIVQSLTAYVDISVAAYFICAMACIVIWSDSGALIDLIASGCSLALLQGVKPHSFLFTIVLLSAAIVLLRKKNRRLLPGFRTLIVLSLALIIGSYWLGFRSIRFKNPFYPFELKLGELQLFPGPWKMDADQLTRRELSPKETALLERTEGKILKKMIHLIFSWFELGVIDNSRIHTLSGGFGTLFGALLIPAGCAGMVCSRKYGLFFIVIIFGLTVTPLSHVARYTPMLPFVFLAPAGLWLKEGRSRWILPFGILVIITGMGLWMPDLAGNYGMVFLAGPVAEIGDGRIGIGVIFFGSAVLLALIDWRIRSVHWMATGFLPALIVTLLSAYRFPVPAKIIEFTGYSREEALRECWNWHRLTNHPDELAQVETTLKMLNQSDETIAYRYSGTPFPPVIGLLFNRRLSNLVEWSGDPADRFQITHRTPR